MRCVLLAATLAVLSACSHPAPAIVGAPPPGIAYRVENGDVGATQQRADHYCQQFGKHASLDTVEHPAGAPVAQYSCS
jgi:putative hemolysin